MHVEGRALPFTAGSFSWFPAPSTMARLPLCADAEAFDYLHTNEDGIIKGPAAIENILQTLSRVEGIKCQHKVLVVVNGS